MTLRGAAILAPALFVVATSLSAAKIETLDVSRKQSRYSLAANAHLDATPESVYAVLMDYDDNAYHRISSVYKESRYLEPAPDGSPIVYTRMEGCMLRICVTLRRTERLEVVEPRYIKSYTLPEQSNFKYSTSEWTLEPDGAGGTNMIYKLEMEPDFRLPPIIGPWYLKRMLSQGGVRAVMRIERLARQLEGLPVGPEIPSGGRR